MSLRQTNSIFPNLSYLDAVVDPLFPLMDSSSAVSATIRCYDLRHNNSKIISYFLASRPFSIHEPQVHGEEVTVTSLMA
jgi:hypothetical protein